MVHLTAYVAVLLAWFHQEPNGNEFVFNKTAAAYWTALYVFTLALIVAFRFARPLLRAFWYQLKVADVTGEGPNVFSLRMTGRHVDQLHARAGQFFGLRFLTWKLMWQLHPFSLSAAPDGQSLRFSIKISGDFTRTISEIDPGTRVLAEGPFGHLTGAVRRRDRVALIAGGIGVTPMRALLEEMPGDVVLIYRAASEEEFLFRDELETLCRDRGARVYFVTGEAFAAAKAQTFTGPTEQSQYGPIQVSIVVKSKKITAVKVVNTPPDARAVTIQGQAIPVLKRETLKAQSAKINTVSGTTQTSQAYIQSLKSAISKAKKAKALK